jgi:tRNA modification GTPase
MLYRGGWHRGLQICVSGPGTRDALEAFCGGAPLPASAAARARPARLELDRGLVLFSGAGQFHRRGHGRASLHGSRAVIRVRCSCAARPPRTRLAEPGELLAARRNGKLDHRVEGLPIWSAETEAQRRQALAQSEGSLRHLYEGWRAELLGAQALVEAGLDFADEGDVATDVSVKAGAIVDRLLSSIARHLADHRGERLRDGFRIVIADAERRPSSAQRARQTRRGDRPGGGGHHARCHRVHLDPAASP